MGTEGADMLRGLAAGGLLLSGSAAAYASFDPAGAAIAASQMDAALRPTLARVLPPSMLVTVYSSSRGSLIGMLSQATFGPYSGADHSTEAFGLNFRSDLGNSAGLDKDGSLLEFNYRLGAGFAVVGTVLSRPHTGNLEVSFAGSEHNPWVPLADSHACLNSLGLPSKGIDEAVLNIAAFKQKWKPEDFPVGLSIMGHPFDSGAVKQQGIIDCVLKALPVADFIEINESCPNVAHHSGGDEELKARLVAVVQARDAGAKAGGRRVPILVKLGDLGNVEHTVLLMESIGVDGIVGLNTQKDYSSYTGNMSECDKSVLEYFTQTHKGGLSGPVIRQKALSQMQAAAKVIESKPEIKLRLVHVGGIESARDVAQSRAAGKTVVLREWYTGLMHALATHPIDSLYEDIAK